jgi:high potential iron-sulfur protein
MPRSNRTTDAERRRLLKLAALGLVAAPFASSVFSTPARAADLPMVDEADPTAKALGYHCDGAKNAARTDKTAFCEGCLFYTAQAGGKSGACALFPGKAVCPKGWCSSWQKKVS